MKWLILYSPWSSLKLNSRLLEQGYTGPNGGACEVCIAGKYKEAPGSEGCEACKAGTYSEEEGATSRDVCKECPADSDSFEGSAAVEDCACNAGYTGPDGDKCVACLPGTYKDEEGPGECIECEQGTYSIASGASSQDTCTECSKISWTSGPGSTVCECNAGYSGSDGDDKRCLKDATYTHIIVMRAHYADISSASSVILFRICMCRRALPPMCLGKIQGHFWFK